MKLVTGALKLCGGVAVTLAVMAFLSAASLFVVGAMLITWPILRQSPRTRRKNAAAQVAVSLFALAQAFAPEEDEDDAEIGT